MEDRAVRRVLCEFLRELAVTERAVEVQRAVLAEVPTFDSISAFKELARLNPDCITSTDLFTFMQRLKVKVDEQGALELCRALSFNGNIHLDEFLKAITPTRGTVSQQAHSERLTYEAEYALARVFAKKLEGLKNIEFCRQDLERQPQGIARAYNLLSTSRPNGLTRDVLQAFLTSYTTDLSSEDVSAVFDLIDRDKDGLISFSEFVDIASPQQPFYKIEPAHSTELSERHKAAIAEASRIESSGGEGRSPSLNKSIHSAGYESPRKREGYVSVTPKSAWKSSSFSEVTSPAVKLPYILCQLMQREFELNKIQQLLVEFPNFSPQSVFRLFDPKNYGNITLNELRTGLQATSIQADPKALKLLFMRYDRDSDGRLSFSDFLPMIVPADYASSPNGTHEPTRDILMTIGRLFLMHQKNEASLEGLRESLNATEAYQFYALLSRSRAHSAEASPVHFQPTSSQLMETEVNERRLKQLISSSGFTATDTQIQLLMYRLDSDADGVVSYTDFLETFARKQAR